MRRILVTTLTVVLALGATACSDDDDLDGGDADLFIGTFVATSMIFSPDGGTPIDVVPFGAGLSVDIDDEGDFAWSFTAPGEAPENLTGEVTVNEAAGTVTVDFAGSDEDDFTADYTFSNDGDRLTLEADDLEFDIDSDGTPESGSFQVVMERQ